MNRKLRFGMVGGGRGAFIGAVHRLAAQMDGEAELVAGAFSSDPERSKQSGADLGLDPKRIYDTYATMAAREAKQPPATRLDFVVIVTPNDQHMPCAKRFLETGFNVVCDKPLALNLDEALALQRTVHQTRKVFVLTHNYTGHAMVKQARALVRSGHLGAVRSVHVEYVQGWLALPLEATGHKQATWRTDPTRSGATGCLGDIGTHAEHLARYITGLELDALCADLTTFVSGRRLEDDAHLLLRFRGGAKGILHCSQIAVGSENDLNIRIYGEQGALAWSQECPDELVVSHLHRPTECWRRGNPYLDAEAAHVTRIPSGHPEGYLEAFANLYRAAFPAIRAEVAGEPLPTDPDFPSIDDGVIGMRFLNACLRSARIGSHWVPLIPDQAHEVL